MSCERLPSFAPAHLHDTDDVGCLGLWVLTWDKIVGAARDACWSCSKLPMQSHESGCMH